MPGRGSERAGWVVREAEMQAALILRALDVARGLHEQERYNLIGSIIALEVLLWRARFGDGPPAA